MREGCGLYEANGEHRPRSVVENCLPGFVKVRVSLAKIVTRTEKSRAYGKSIYIHIYIMTGGNESSNREAIKKTRLFKYISTYKDIEATVRSVARERS